ncbi:MAG: biopolymer transporter ExbD [Planctomycetia bacterium]|nr:biopolymer transporter ExbD [Planctomycetia bacterium]
MRRVTLSLTPAELNMTPMIDIVFLLITFFTLVINFSQAEQDERVMLPLSELAQPPESASADLFTVQVTAGYEVLLGTHTCYLDSMPMGVPTTRAPFSKALNSELRVLEGVSRTMPKDVTLVIRADENVTAGFVERLIMACQEQGIESYVLRARQGKTE